MSPLVLALDLFPPHLVTRGDAMTTDPIDPRQALDAYAIGDIHAITPAGGTAGSTWKITAATGEYFFRLRGVRTSTQARLRFDHGLRRHLIAGGVLTAQAVLTRTGDSWLRRAEGVFELYPFITGRPIDPEALPEVAEASRALALYHLVAARYAPPSPEREPIAQYTTLGFSEATSDRMDDPDLLLQNMHALTNLPIPPEDRLLVERCKARVEAMRSAYAGPAYEALTGWVIHGDYTPANLLFADDPSGTGDPTLGSGVSGDAELASNSASDGAGVAKGRVYIFDLDWALPGARCRDVADGLYFFATRPRRIDASSIWSLTDAAEFDTDRCLVFMRAYQAVAPLQPHELAVIPHAFAGRWFSIRLEGMAKVPESQRLRFFCREVNAPVEWLDERWESLVRVIAP